MSSSTVLDSLKDILPSDQIAINGTEAFAKLNNSYLSLLQRDLSPAAILLPRSKDEVAKIVQFLKPHALKGEIQFAIRGAGQQPVPGCSNISGNGVTIDLRHLTGIEVKDGLVSVGAGERWGAVYEKLTEHGLGVGGSRSALGGIGGLALSGTRDAQNTAFPQTHGLQVVFPSSPPEKVSSATTLSTTRSSSRTGPSSMPTPARTPISGERSAAAATTSASSRAST